MIYEFSIYLQCGYFRFIALAHVDASVQYPMVTGGVMIVSTLICFLGAEIYGKRTAYYDYITYVLKILCLCGSSVSYMGCRGKKLHTYRCRYKNKTRKYKQQSQILKLFHLSTAFSATLFPYRTSGIFLMSRGRHIVIMNHFMQRLKTVTLQQM